MRRDPLTRSITIRLPNNVIKAIDTAAKKIRLTPHQGMLPEDYYRGGRSAIIRLLLALGLKAFKTRPTRNQKKG